MKRFELGNIYITRGALAAFKRNGQAQGPANFLRHHQGGDWGELSAEDEAANEHALKHGLRLLSAYRLADGTKIWIISEADRSASTILLPAEY